MARLSTLCLFSLLLLLAPRLTAQQTFDPTSVGRTYVVAFPDTTENTSDARYPNPMRDTIALYIYSSVATEVYITGNGYADTVDLQANVFATVYLNDSTHKAPKPIVTESNKVSEDLFRVEAKDPILIYCYICTKYGCEAWTPLPVESWGLEYYAAANEQEIVQNIAPTGGIDYISKNKAAPAEVCILSAYDNTTITIVPSLRQQKDNLPDWVSFPNLTLTLAANRAYQVQGFIDTLTAHYGEVQPDIAGVYVYADKPIGVISGNTRAQLNPYENAGIGRNSFKNMNIEALAPVDQHGREFVFTPTMDDRILTGQPGEPTAEKRTGEIVRVYGTSIGVTNAYFQDNAGGTTPFTVENATSYDNRVGAPIARYYRTDTPAQAFKSCLSAVKNLSTSGTTKNYDSWGTYMVEMVPREQWVTFAPFIAPLHPSGMQHYVNIVTDTNSRLKIFDENNAVVSGWIKIPGTDIMWTSRDVTPGVNKFFRSTDSSARFYAFAYGLLKGKESFTPFSAGGYKEELAGAYGYPVAPRRAVLRAPDSLIIMRTEDCDSLIVEVQALNVPKPIGFRSISLDSTSGNTRIAFITPADSSPASLVGRNYIKLRVTAIDPDQDAAGSLVITDRTGRSKVVPFTYQADRATFNTDSNVLFGEQMVGTGRDTTITITNSLSRPLRIERFTLAEGTSFTIVAPTPAPTPARPFLIQPGESRTVTVRFTPERAGSAIFDSLYVQYHCRTQSISLQGTGTTMSGVEWSTRVDGEVSLRPTPVGSHAEIALHLRQPARVELSLLDERGTEVQHATWMRQAGEALLPLDVSSLPSGIYYCRLTVDGVMRTIPFPVVR